LFYLACAAEEEEGFWNRFKLEWSAVSWMRVTLKITIGSDKVHVQISRSPVSKILVVRGQGVGCTCCTGRSEVVVEAKDELSVASIAQE
jgi:hypothetical protein